MSSIENFIGVNLKDDAVSPVLARTVLAMYRELIKEGALDTFSTRMTEFTNHEADFNNPHRVTLSQLGDITQYLYQAYLSNVPDTETALSKEDFITTILGQEDIAMEFFCRLILNNKDYSIADGTETTVTYNTDYNDLLVVEPITRKGPLFSTTPITTNSIDYVIGGKSLPYTLNLGTLTSTNYSGVFKAKFVGASTNQASLTLKTADYTIEFQADGPGTDLSKTNIDITAIATSGSKIVGANITYTLPDGTTTTITNSIDITTGTLSLFCRDGCLSFSIQNNTITLYLSGSVNTGTVDAPIYQYVDNVTVTIPLSLSATAANIITEVEMNMLPIAASDILADGVYLDTFILYGEALPLEALNFYNYML